MDIRTKPEPYRPYVPKTRAEKLAAGIDKLVSLVSPQAAEKRLLSRERIHRFSYLAARANGSLPNAHTGAGSGETMQGQRERLQLIWNSLEALENSGLASGIRGKICDYVCGTLRWQARTGNDAVNNEHEDYLRAMLGKQMDVTGRNGVRKFARLVVSGQMTRGDIGVNVVRDGRIKFQGIEADRIGNPIDTRVSETYIGGVHLTPWRAHVGYDVFSKDPMSGMYRFTQTIPIRDEQGLARFLLCVNPITFDDVRGRTVFKNTLRNIRYLDNIRDFELQALEWAASQSGVYYTKTGQLPDSPFEPDGADVDADYGALPSVADPVLTMRTRPNTIQALGIGEDVKMFQHDRPSPNVVAMYRETVKDIALGVGVSFGFAYDMSGMLGGAVRSASNQDKRALQTWKEGLREDFLDVAATLLLIDGIQDEEIAPHPLAFNGVWQFPAHPTIDVGRESAADINERNALLKSGAMIAGEYGEDIDDIRRDCAAETEADLTAAMEISDRVFERTGERVPWRECLTFLKPGENIVMSPQFEAARAEQLDTAAAAAEESAKRNQDLASGAGAEMQD